MPDVAQHHAFGQDVKAALPPEIREYLLDVPFTFALYGPDPWFMYQPWMRRNGRGRRMHTTRTGAFLISLALQARDGSAPREMFSYLAGFLCHYALDSTAHPYIIWQTTETWPFKRAHRDLEHALDISLLKQEGYWGEPHPVTDHHFPLLVLPESMSKDLDEAYGRVYGWKNVRASLNRCFRQYRMLYRHMEKPRSLLTLLATIIPTHRFRSIAYVRSAFLSLDTENLSHRRWYVPCAREIFSTESYPDLYRKALAMAVRCIRDGYAFSRKAEITEARLRDSLGNRSYLSGLDADDPRNQAVRGLRPSD